MNKQEREALVEYFKEQFEIKHERVPTMRRTKCGGFMFDEGGEGELHIDVGQIAHHAYFMNK